MSARWSRRRTSRPWWRRRRAPLAAFRRVSSLCWSELRGRRPGQVSGRGLGREPWLSAKEVELLSIRKGSLSASERKKIEKHVRQTYEFLKALPWTGDLRVCPEIAYAHHEKLNGTGYPRKLEAAAKSRASRR